MGYESTICAPIWITLPSRAPWVAISTTSGSVKYVGSVLPYVIVITTLAAYLRIASQLDKTWRKIR